jgi:serine/threonine-protein kinase
MQPGDVVDDYEIVRPLAEGGMAELFLVRHRKLGSVHVLKQLKPECSRRKRLRKQFLAEGRVQAQLRHRHIVAVTDLIATDDATALILDYLPGRTLADRLYERDDNLSPAEAMAVLCPLLEALAFAHDHGVVHRDLKPDNILFRSDGWHEAALSDFGIAKVGEDAEIAGTKLRATRTGVTMGTPGYMAPEQIKGHVAVGPATDLFAVGVIAWEMLLGVPPFVGVTEYEVMDRIVTGARPRLEAVGASLPPPIRDLLERMIAIDPALRFQRADTLAQAWRDAVTAAGPGAQARVPRRDGADVPYEDAVTYEPLDPFADEAGLFEATEQFSAPSETGTHMAMLRGAARGPAPTVVPTARRIRSATLLGSGTLLATAMLTMSASSPGATRAPGSPWDAARSYQGVGGAVLREHHYEVLPVYPEGITGVGSPDDEIGRDADEPLTQVSVSRFAMGSTEVTQALWTSVMGDNPVRTRSQDWGGLTGADAFCSRWGVEPDLPVFCVTWREAIEFCNRLSQLEGLPPAYEIGSRSVRWTRSSTGYRLPTEAEWELASRAGAGDPYAPAPRSGDLCRYGNVADWWTAWSHPLAEVEGPSSCSDAWSSVAPVAHFRGNAWGLYDTVGNVSEWVWDPYVMSGVSTHPPSSRRTTSRTVVRGGNWASSHDAQRAADREWGDPRQRSWLVGLRIARSLE